jgi:hypothetical protein
MERVRQRETSPSPMITVGEAARLLSVSTGSTPSSAAGSCVLSRSGSSSESPGRSWRAWRGAR